MNTHILVANALMSSNACRPAHAARNAASSGARRVAEAVLVKLSHPFGLERTALLWLPGRSVPAAALHGFGARASMVAEGAADDVGLDEVYPRVRGTAHAANGHDGGRDHGGQPRSRSAVTPVRR